MGRGRSDPRSIKRAGQQVRRRLRADSWAAVRKHRSVLAVFLLGYLATVSATGLSAHLLGVSRFTVGFYVGGLLGLLPFFWLTFLVGRGIAHRSMGAEAEQWTAQELAKLDDRRWVVFHDVALRWGNLDHVAIGPGRVYAIETKWTARDDLDRFLQGAGWQAQRQASELQALLDARGVGRSVVPLLVVWGPAVAAAFAGKPRLLERTKTRAVAGADALDWLARMNEATDRLENDWPAHCAIEDHIREQPASPSAATPG